MQLQLKDDWSAIWSFKTYSQPNVLEVIPVIGARYEPIEQTLWKLTGNKAYKTGGSFLTELHKVAATAARSLTFHRNSPFEPKIAQLFNDCVQFGIPYAKKLSTLEALIEVFLKNPSLGFWHNRLALAQFMNGDGAAARKTALDEVALERPGTERYDKRVKVYDYVSEGIPFQAPIYSPRSRVPKRPLVVDFKKISIRLRGDGDVHFAEMLETASPEVIGKLIARLTEYTGSRVDDTFYDDETFFSLTTEQTRRFLEERLRTEQK